MTGSEVREGDGIGKDPHIFGS